MTAKEYLLKSDRARDNIGMITKQIESLDAAMVSFGTAVTDGSKVQSCPPQDPQGDKIVLIVDKKSACERRLLYWQGILANIAIMLADIECVTCYTVLRLRYLECDDSGGVKYSTLRDVADVMKYSYTSVRNYHRIGVEEIKIIP